ncbi:MAG: PilZ domain-containing protein [Candidatus Omnitrophica bacterium]|nr:PilZ domain-containing protein [Candidatus Omnitrophota bacterium]
MPGNYPQEKRKLVRFLITIPLKHIKISMRSFNSSCTHDISAQGVGLITPEELPVNTPLILCLKIPDNGEEISLEAEVVWSTRMSSEQYRSGLKLKNNPIKPIPLVLRTIYSKL